MSPANKAITAVIALALIVGGLWWYMTAGTKEVSQVMCTMEAMQCPDGTWVGRSGPNCEFVCPGTVTTGSTLQGTVVAPE